MALPPLAIDALAETLLGCVCQTLNDTAALVEGQPGCPCRACLVPGTPAWDSCEDPCGNPQDGAGGQLTVSLARILTAPDLGGARTPTILGARSCPAPTMSAELVVTLLRCAPSSDEEGCPPTCEQLAAAARVLHVDATSVHNALVCCFPQTGPPSRRYRYTLGQLTVLGPEGQCVGVEQRVTIALPNCACPEES
ncbi:hypothetical protein [Streptomyces sp. NRRL B-1347]|uniref:hypothetical protein n=1 Tax=Streptomyces sp. NRRL B-1347 TaxID=1476877 RepID=UPI0004CACB08|nr:hypothetical protein [Streptomyces sp. NRRL B-1347]